MKRVLKWSGLGIVAGGAIVLMYKAALVARRQIDRGLVQAEQMASEARQAVERTQEALEHTERVIQGVRRTVS